MRRRISTLTIALTLATSSCYSPQQLAAMQARREAERLAAVEAINQQLQQNCSHYGFTPNTDAFAACYQRETEKYNARQERAEAVQKCKDAMLAIGQARSGGFGGSIETPQDQQNCEIDPQAHLRKQYQN